MFIYYWCNSQVNTGCPVKLEFRINFSSIIISQISHRTCLYFKKEFWDFPNGSVVKNLPATEKKMATHSSSLAWKIPWTEELSRLHSMGLQRVRHDWVTSLYGKIPCVKHVHLNFHETTLCSLIKLLSIVHRKKKNLPASVESTGSIPGLGRSHILGATKPMHLKEE